MTTEVLAELEKAHALIQLMLNELTPAAKTRFVKKADRAGLIVEGATRFHERAEVIAKAKASADADRQREFNARRFERELADKVAA